MSLLGYMIYGINIMTEVCREDYTVVANTSIYQQAYRVNE